MKSKILKKRYLLTNSCTKINYFFSSLQKKLAVDLCEIAIKWEVQRVRDDANNINSQEDGLGMIGLKRPPPASDVVIGKFNFKFNISPLDGYH